MDKIHVPEGEEVKELVTEMSEAFHGYRFSDIGPSCVAVLAYCIAHMAESKQEADHAVSLLHADLKDSVDSYFENGGGNGTH